MLSPVMEVTSRSGLMTTELIQTDKTANSVLSAQDIGEVRKNVPFQILVTNFSKKAVNLPDNMLIVVGTKQPKMDIAYEKVESSSETSVTAVHNKESEERWTQMEWHWQGATAIKKRKAYDWRQELKTDQKFQEHREKFLQMIKQLKWMSDRHLALISIFEHRIKLMIGLEETLHCVRHPAGPKPWEVREGKIQKMPEMKVVEPAETEWAAPIVFAQKNGVSLTFRVDYRNPKAVSVHDYYPYHRWMRVSNHSRTRWCCPGLTLIAANAKGDWRRWSR